jgi:xylulose-5-phosphate/fructose-6-phosphate phosphoketolase
MVVLNRMSRYHLALEALRRMPRQLPGAKALTDHCNRQLDAHAEYIREHFEDLPEIREWAWTPPG